MLYGRIRKSVLRLSLIHISSENSSPPITALFIGIPEELVKSEEYLLCQLFILIRSNMMASPVTAAISGRCLWCSARP